jgi:hypothetical protein
MTPLVLDRLVELERRSLQSGSHPSLTDGACALELVSYLAGEPWSDHPECVCPTLGVFFRGWNDGLPSDAERDRLLKPFLPRLIGTRGTPALAEARAYLALDWLVRVHTPAWLDLQPELQSHAQALRALEALRDAPSVTIAQPVLAAALAAAGAAAGAAAWDAAWDAAGAAAGAAAWDAAGEAAWDAAGAAAWDAAWDAAGAAAWDALAPTVTRLQVSASDLAERMIALTE